MRAALHCAMLYCSRQCSPQWWHPPAKSDIQSLLPEQKPSMGQTAEEGDAGDSSARGLGLVPVSQAERLLCLHLRIYPA